MIALVLAIIASPSGGAIDDIVASSTISDAELDATIGGRRELPSLASVQEAALETWAAPDAGWASRARWRGLVPRIDLSAGTDDDLDVRDTMEARTTAQGHALGLRVTARFELGQLVFADAELRASRDFAALEAQRRAIVERATELYFDRLEVLIAGRVAPTPSLTLRARSLDGLLRALTGGRLDRKEK